jgi:orc1/cdc6 family replication initiation protein
MDGMIVDARVLRDEFIPREVVHRDPEIHALADTLEPLAEDGRGQNSMVFGPPGTGKTCIAQHTLDRLSEQNLELKYKYINCWENYNRFKVLYKALEGIGKTLDVHRQSTPTDELFTRLKGYSERQYVLILDEVDQLEDERVLYDLYSLPSVTLVMIANKQTAFHNMEDRVRSRLMDSARIEFEEYGVDELEDIVADRAEWGIEPDAISRSEIRKIALSAEGDARIAIGILRSAARKAENRGMDEITADLVQESVPDAKDRQRQKNVEKLNKHQEKLYEIVNDAGEIAPGDLYDRYRDAVEDPRSDRMLRKYLNKMVHYNLIDAEGDGRWRRYKSTS